MGYFAVLRASDETQSRVRRCHLNLWALPGLWPGRRLLYLDVGLDILAVGNTDVNRFDLLLPFGVETAKWPEGDHVAQDLYDVLCTDDVAELVFGGPVRQLGESDQRVLRVSDYTDDLTLIRLNVDGVKPAQDYTARSDSSLYTVELQRPIPVGQSRYVRMRWRVLEPGQLWVKRRRTGGVRIDFRVCDVRESAFVDRERRLRPKICEIEKINFFLMAPPRLQPGAYSPQFTYLRVLEPGAWRTYLGGMSYFRKNSGFLVYYWKRTSSPDVQSKRANSALGGRPITAENPFRVFLDLHQAPTLGRWQVLRVFIGVLLAIGAINIVDFLPPVDKFTPHLSSGALIAVLSFLGVSAFASALKKVRGWFASRFIGPRRWARSFERFILDRLTGR
jgi:hypothetical protein